ncbi:MAG: LysR family transcriptional regulator [Lachnospiraceae bacterium]|nr:LysR family transcriptional regulator [Lachnospiraceae bacterium]
MDISTLREFVTLVENLSFFETAEAMHISQSSLTKHIKKLEEELQVELFDRSTRRVRPNEYSTAFYQYAKQILLLYVEATSSINALKVSSSNRLTIAYTPLMGQYGIAELLAGFYKRNPYISLNMVESFNPLDLLLQNKCDFVFLSGDGADNPELGKIFYKSDSMAVILPAKHRLAGERKVALAQLKDEKFIFHKEDPIVSKYDNDKIVALCKAAGFDPAVVTTSSFSSTIVKLVGQEIGVALMNRLQIPATNSAVAIVDIEPRIPYHIHLLYLKKKKLLGAASVFMKYFKARRPSSANPSE